MVSPMYVIKQVSTTTKQAEDVVVSFRDGSSAVVRKARPDSEWMLPYLRACAERHSLVGVYLDARGAIADVAGALRSMVAGVQQPRPAAADIEVWFAGLDGPMRLATDHPAFADLHRLLVQAREAGLAVWYVMKGGYLVDVQAPSAAEDAELYRLVEQRWSARTDS